MKKYFIVGVLAVCFMAGTHAPQAQAQQVNAAARTVLIQQLTVKLQELITELRMLLEKQDTVIRAEVSMTRVNAELYFTLDYEKGYAGVCTDLLPRITNSAEVKKAEFTINPTYISCVSTANAYALSIKSSKGYYCADSTGLTIETVKPVTGVTCPVK